MSSPERDAVEKTEGFFIGGKGRLQWAGSVQRQSIWELYREGICRVVKGTWHMLAGSLLTWAHMRGFPLSIEKVMGSASLVSSAAST